MALTQVTTGGVDENISIDSNTLKVDGTNNRVGIGTASPTALLHIDGTNPNLIFGSTGNELTYLQRYVNDFYIFNKETAGNLILGTANTERVRIDSSGNVGVGLTPGVKFDIDVTNSALRVKSDTSAAQILITSDDNASAKIEFGDESDNDRGAITYDNPNNALIFQANATERMRIDSSGRLLLGSTTVYSPSGGGSTPVTVVDGGNHRANLVISNQTNHADAGAAVILAAHGQDWQLEATSVLKGNRDFTIKAGTNERLRLDNSGRFLYGTSTGVNLNNAGGA